MAFQQWIPGPAALSAAFAAAAPRPPAHFEPADRGFLFRGADYAAQVAAAGITVLAPGGGGPVEIRFAGARSRQGYGVDPTGGVSNYFRGTDPGKWRSKVPHFRNVRFRGVWPGVDVVHRTHEGNIEFDFIVYPGGDPGSIALALEGGGWRVRGDGVELHTDRGVLTMRRPRVFQGSGKGRKELAARYALRDNRVTFEIEGYDESRELLIDPELAWSTYLGGSAEDTPHGAAIDSTGAVVVCGDTKSADFPITAGALDGRFRPNSDSLGSQEIFVAKLNEQGTAVVFATFLGGAANDQCKALALDASDNIFLTGHTRSADFPVTAQAYSQTGSGFLAKLAPAGNRLVYSTRLPVTGDAMALDRDGNAFVVANTGRGTIPTTVGAARPSDFGTAHLMKIDPSGSRLIYSTGIGPGPYFLGIVQIGGGSAVAVDRNGSAYVAGVTADASFRTTTGAYDTTYGGGVESWLVKVSPSGGSIDFSTFLGSFRFPVALAVAGDGGVLACGELSSTTTGRDAAVMKLSPDGSRAVFTATIGGGGVEALNGLALLTDESIVVVGATDSSNFPITAGALDLTPPSPNDFDGFVARLSADGRQVLYATYLGGPAADTVFDVAVRDRDIVVAGHSRGGFTVTGPRTTHAGDRDVFVARINDIVPAPFQAPAVSEIVSAASLVPPVAAGSWMAIRGSQFAPSRQVWRASDFSGDQLPLSLGGVTVTVNGARVPVYSASPAQVVALAPRQSAGSAAVVVTNPAGSSSGTVEIRESAPSFYLLEPGGRQYPAASLFGGGAVLAKPGVLGPEYAARPIRAGDKIFLYASGLGTFDPPVDAERLYQGFAQITGNDKAVARAGGRETPIDFIGLVNPLDADMSGLVPGVIKTAAIHAAGLHMVVITVPGLAPGDYPIALEVDGVRTQENVWLPISN